MRAVLVVVVLALLAACSSGSKHSVIDMGSGAPTCDSLIGKPLPKSVKDNGCTVNGELFALASFECTDGSSLYQWSNYWATTTSAVYKVTSGEVASDPTYKVTFNRCNSSASPSAPQRKVLDHTAVERTVEKGGYTGVVCNGGENPEVKKGATFTCTADGGKEVTVTMTNDSGNYAWSPS